MLGYGLILLFVVVLLALIVPVPIGHLGVAEIILLLAIIGGIVAAFQPVTNHLGM